MWRGAAVQEAVVDMFVRVSVGVHEETATQQYKLCEVTHNHHLPPLLLPLLPLLFEQIGGFNFNLI